MRVALFVTCLVDLFRPGVAQASLSLLKHAGCEVDVPLTQTCCGQPAFNNGDEKNAAAIARQVIAAFEQYDYVVAPSGSCAGMLRVHYPELLQDDPHWQQRARDFAQRCYELTRFLISIAGMESVPGAYAGKITYHDSCSALRELHIKREPRALLANVAGLELAEMPDTESCCGFGGTFCVKYPQISAHMVDDKINNIEASGADTVLSADLGCLLNIAGRLRFLNKSTRVLHIAEVLAGLHDTPGIGAAKK